MTARSAFDFDTARPFGFGGDVTKPLIGGVQEDRVSKPIILYLAALAYVHRLFFLFSFPHSLTTIYINRYSVYSIKRRPTGIHPLLNTVTEGNVVLNTLESKKRRPNAGTPSPREPVAIVCVCVSCRALRVQGMVVRSTEY